MSDVVAPDGTVISSSQIEHDGIDPKSYGPMIGVVVGIQPSDDVDNLSSSVNPNKRGFRNECLVVVWDEDQQSNLILEHVVIPPIMRSNYDDYFEDLPVGIKGTLSGDDLTPNWKNIPISDLDGDMCVIQFIGGSRERPYISGWWPHTENRIDPATSGQGCLTQVDLNRQRSRMFRRVNGVEQTVTSDGDIYLSTSKAASKIDLTGDKPVRREFGKGGSIQVDVKGNQQLEFNWNTFVEGLKAGSNSQSQEREPQLPHLDHAKAEHAPVARSTDDTILRFKKQEGTISTGKMVVYCHKNGGGDGFFMATGEDGVVIGQGEAGDTLATVSLSGGNVILNTKDGDSVTLQSDNITIANKSGAMAQLAGPTAILSAPGGVSLGGVPAAPLINATTYLPAQEVLMNAWNGALTALQAVQGEWAAAAAISSPWTPNAATQTTLATALATLITALAGFIDPTVAATYSTKLTTAA